MGKNRALKILVAPLDWGLGHTTRCVPLIRYMQQLGHHIILAGNEWQRKYIEETFPGIETIHLDGYGVTYSKTSKGFMLSILSQVPRLLKTIRKEHDWLLRITKQQQFDAILSDNRYGLFHPHIPCVIMTHQLLAQTGMGDAMDNMLRKFHYNLLRRYSQCWIVDVPGKPNLSGRLAHPDKIPGNAKYIGLLTQMSPVAHTKEEHLLVLLSGPEPQRTMLSDILWEQAKDYKGKLVFVEGSDTKPRLENSSPLGGNREVTNAVQEGAYYTRITKETLQPLIENASMVICRSGYSTLMDLAILGKKAILVPTPGQTEQELLGKHLHKEGVFYSAAQKSFDLQHVLNDAKLFPFKKLDMADAFDKYKPVVEEWVLGISN